MADPESAKDLALLEVQYRDIHARRERLQVQRQASILPLPQDPVMRLSMAARRELRCYRDAVCEDSRRLRANSTELVRRSREARRLRLAGG